MRSALWRLDGFGVRLLKTDKHGLAMCDDVLVDLHVVGAWAIRLIRGSVLDADLGDDSVWCRRYRPAARLV